MKETILQIAARFAHEDARGELVIDLAQLREILMQFEEQ
jgi:hypothetical protein